MSEPKEPAKEWNGAIVRTWLESRVASARADQVVAERGGRHLQDDCDKAAAEEMVCAFLKTKPSVDSQSGLADDLRGLLDRDEYLWRGVYNDAKFDRHVRTYVRKLMRMAKLNEGFETIRRYQ